MRNRYGLTGSVLSHSLSPEIHKLILRYAIIDGSYELFPLEESDLPAFIRGLKEKEIAGINVTVPYKMRAFELVDFASYEAKKTGAVNTIKVCADGLHGHNTDYFGIKETFRFFNIHIAGRRAIILGSGGAAKTVSEFLKDEKVGDIIIVSRDADDAKKKFSDAKVTDYDNLSNYHGYDLLINATSAGMYPNTEECPVDEYTARNFSFVFDLIYNPSETKLLRSAKTNGSICINGLYMLICQAVRSQEIWNDRRMSGEITRKIYEDMKDAGYA